MTDTNLQNKDLKEIKGTQFVDEFSKEIYEQTYKYAKETINDTQLRVAKDLASIETDPEFWTNQFLWALENFKFVPGGRITSNAGTGLKGTTYINCFTPNTLVLTNKGYKPIVDIEIGDMVLTHKGRFKPVVSLMSKEHNGNLISFSSSFTTGNIESTSEHPFYRGENKWVDAELASDIFFLKENKKNNQLTIDVLNYVKDVKRKQSNGQSIIADDEYVYSTSEWINPNGGKIISRNKSKTKRFIKVDESFAYFIGRYVGDGSVFSVNGDYEVDGFNLIFNTKEIDSQLQIKNIIDNAFGVETNINNSKEFEASYIRKNNIVISNFLLNACGRYSESKRVPDFIWNSNESVRQSFVLGLLDADGTITDKEVKIVINNEMLINDLQALLFLCKIPSNKGVEFIKNKPYYRISLVREYASILLSASQKVYSDNRINEYCEETIVKNKTQYKTSINKITNDVDGEIFFENVFENKTNVSYNGLVYNISVLDDESYVVNNVIVHNCFVDGFVGEDRDSMEGIMAALKRQALILKSEGGYGFCADTMRPRGGFISGIGNESPGSVKMLDMWDTQSAVITAGSGRKVKKEKAKSKIRKGAQMVTMSCWHPDIEEFIISKQTPGRLTKFNMSVLVTDEFMEAVENNQPWNLEFPNFDAEKELYKSEWDGDLKKWKAKGYSTEVYKTYENANELWELIMQSTYNRNEPGVLFVDTMNKLNNLYYCEYISATNPCLPNNAWILTSDGPRQVKDLIGKQFTAIANGMPYKSGKNGFFFTGNKETFIVKTKKGYLVEATANHPLKKVTRFTRYSKDIEWTEVGNLKVGDKISLSNHRMFSEWDGEGNFDKGWLVGSLLGDGTINGENSNGATLTYWGETKKELYEIAKKRIKNNFSVHTNFGQHHDNTNSELVLDKISVSNNELLNYAVNLIGCDKNILPLLEKTNSEFYRGFLSGWFDADGSVQGNKEKGVSVRLSSSNLNNLYIAQRMLARLGIISTVYKNRRKEQFKNMLDGKGGEKSYFCQAQHELVVSSDNLLEFKHKIVFSESGKQNLLNNLISTYNRKLNRERFVDEIVSITKTEVSTDVYDCQIEEVHEFDANGISVHNCGEQILPTGGVCLLGSINLTQFIDFKKGNWDYEKLKQLIPIAIRFMDNVNDVTQVPLESQKENLRNKRRIGLGIMGYGSALMMLKVRYGSKKALKLTEELMSFIANTAYQSSAMIASEKGAFPLFDKDLYLKSKFVSNLSDETKELIAKYGVRNSHLLSIQPTGNSSIFANVVSGGLEPVFMPTYVRTSMMPYAPEGLFVPQIIDWENKKYVVEDAKDEVWQWIKEGDENLLKTEFGGYIWKVDKSRGLLRETVVKDYAVRFLEEKNEWNATAEWAATTVQLDIDEHVKTMGIMAKYIDSAMSKTVNIPNEYPYEDFKKLYMDIYRTGTVKGGTTYRAGTMTEVLGSADKNTNAENSNKIQKTNAPQRPKTLQCDICHVTTEGHKWIVIVGLLDGEPYEVFAFKEKAIHIPQRIKSGTLTKIKRGRYDLDADGFIIENIGEQFETDAQEALTRLISVGLRHGADIKFIVEQLNKSEGNITSFSKAIGRTLKKYIPDGEKSTETCPNCQSKNSLVYQEGCVVCVNCSASKCG